MADHDNGATVRLAATIARSRYDAEDGVTLQGLHSETLLEMSLAAKREVDRLRAELSEARHIADRMRMEADRSDDWRDEAIAERDEAIRERDARPAISREDARAWKRGKENASTWRDEDGQKRAIEALRAHAASATKGGE